MTLIHGQIESLKRIRETLDRNGISRFNSINEIKKFLYNYENEKEELIFRIERQHELELDILQTKILFLQKEYEALKAETEAKLENRISQLKIKSESLSRPAKNAIIEVLNWYKQQFFLFYEFILEKSSNYLVWHNTNPSKKRLESVLKQMNYYSSNRQGIISARCAPKLSELEYIKSVANGLYPLIAGAIGEHLVAKELEKLPNSFVLINDFSLTFHKPLYNKRENDRIFSIQIDHLMITPAGIFIIETKNWSKLSLESYNLRSPVKQIQRANFALYVLLNGNNIGPILKQHHWGKKEIPLRNIVAMIHHKPKGKFQYVAIKKLRELNSYINHFEPLFNESEVHRISDYLMKIKE